MNFKRLVVLMPAARSGVAFEGGRPSRSVSVAPTNRPCSTALAVERKLNGETYTLLESFDEPLFPGPCRLLAERSDAEYENRKCVIFAIWHLHFPDEILGVLT